MCRSGAGCEHWHGRPAPRRLPAEPLRAVAPTVGLVAELVGVTRRTMHRWLRDGVPLPVADDVAIALDRHPIELWGPAWYEAAS